MAASSTQGVGQGSALKSGQKGAESFFSGVDKLIGTRIVYSGRVTLTGGTADVVFPATLAGVAGDYIVLCGAIAHAYASDVATTGFTANGTTTQVVSFIVVRISNATVEVN